MYHLITDNTVQRHHKQSCSDGHAMQVCSGLWSHMTCKVLGVNVLINVFFLHAAQ